MARDLTCSEVLPGPGRLLDLDSALPFSTEPSCNMRSPTLPSPASEAKMELSAASEAHSKPLLHVEVCQRAHSSMGDSRIKELVLQLLAEKGTVFRQLMVEEFEEPTLKEHVLSVSITDTPGDVKVRMP